MLLAGFVVSPALGGPGLFTKRKAVKLFYTKKAAKKLFLTKTAAAQRYLSQAEAGEFITKAEAGSTYLPRSETGDFITQAEADNSYLPRSGQITLSIAPQNWVANQPANSSVDYFTNGASLRTGPAGTRVFSAPLDLPLEILGRTVRLDGIDLCYDASGPVSTLSNVSVNIASQTTAGNPIASGISVINDPVDRHDEVCRTYLPETVPVLLGRAKVAELQLIAEFTGSGAIFVGRITVYLSL